MKSVKQIKALFLAVLMLGVLVLAACGSEPESTVADYKVTVVDAAGNPFSDGYAVRFMQNGQQVAMQLPDEQGQSVKNLTKGDYTVELQFTDADAAYHYDKSAMTLTAEKTELTVVLAYSMPAEGSELFAPEGAVTAYAVKEGCTYVKLDSENRSYFLFKPEREGLYEFSVLESTAAIGYYGAPHFVQATSAAEVVNNSFSISVRADSLGNNNSGSFVLVIGIDAAEGDAVLSVERVGDPAWTVADEPWTIYKTTAQIREFSLPENANLVDFDLKAATDTYTLVYNEADGFYHLNTADGPLVLVRLGKNAKSQYIDPFGRIIERSSVTKYFYDDAGEFLKKESYTECLYEYCDGPDADGNGEVESYYYLDKETETYPLTEDLKYIIQSRGEYSQWWDADSIHYLFRDADGDPIPGINNEIAWLFMCCYIG